jgi:hypothetical protein
VKSFGASNAREKAVQVDLGFVSTIAIEMIQDSNSIMMMGELGLGRTKVYALKEKEDR